MADLSDAQLVQAYVDNVQTEAKAKQAGVKDRLRKRMWEIVYELKRRSGGTMQPLRSVLDHDDPLVRWSAGNRFYDIDRAAFDRALREFSDYAEKERQLPASGGLPRNFSWQCDNPPPEAMPNAEIERRLTDALPASVAKHLISLARPAIGLWPQRRRGEVGIDVSRLGGMPHAPTDWSWPVAETGPMPFIGQINCIALKGLPGSERMPASGLMSFFGDNDTVIGASIGGGAVFHFADINRLISAKPPAELSQVFPQAPLSFWSTTDLPDPYCNIAQLILEGEEQTWDYTDVRDAVRYHGIPDDVRSYCGLSKLLGWPSLVQKNDLDMPDANSSNGHRLLLQVDQYSNGDEHEGWGPGGSLYFMIPARDLSKAKFDRCELDMQCT